MAPDELLEQKLFLGQEFLTWLWRLSEEEGAATLPGEKQVGVMLGEMMILGPAQGQEGSRITVRGREVSLAEAREGLRQGKMVESLRLGLLMDEDEYWLTLKAADLGISSLKLPRTSPPEGPDQEEGRLLERVFLVNNALNAINGLFAVFLDQRLEDNAGGRVLRSLKRWSARE